MDSVIGIDLGTTNSEVAVCINGKIEILPMPDGSLLMPSVVGLDQEGKLLVGSEARNQMLLYPENTIRSVKRKMGEEEALQLGTQSYLPQEISAMILRNLKNQAEKRLGHSVSKAVITVPAQFNDAQRNATREAGRIAGLEVLRILNEPTAACLAYVDESPDSQKNLLAFDLGGGTFDVSVVRLENEVTEVMASSGNNSLGGDDFDRKLLEQLCTKLEIDLDGPKGLSRLAQYRLLKAVETAKIQLSEFAFAKIIESNLTLQNGESFAVDSEISRADFEECIAEFIDQSMRAVHDCLSQAGLKPEQIDEIILVGGSTRSLVFQERIEQEFGKRPHADVQPDLAVAYGAGILAARLMGEKQHQVLVDITPYTFGVSCVGILDSQLSDHLFIGIIKSGSALPASCEKLFFTMYDKQKEVEVQVFQGESQDARKNVLIGNFNIEGLSPLPANNEIILSMKLDLDGVLYCSATEKATGLNKHISISNAMAKLTAEQLQESARKIAELFPETESEFDDEQFDADDYDKDESSDSFPERLEACRQRVAKLPGEDVDQADHEELEALFETMQQAIQSGDADSFLDSEEQVEEILFYLES